MELKSLGVFALAVMVLAAAGAIVAFAPEPKHIHDDQSVLTLTCNFGDNVKVTYNGTVYKNGDKLVLTDDAELTVQSLAGRADIKYTQEWTDTSGFHNTESGEELTETMTVYITFLCYGKGTGTIHIWI